MASKLDPDFMWGGAVSNVQAEGSTTAGGKGQNVYDALVVVPEEGQTSEGDVDIASNHYRQFREDIALMKEMGFKAYRFSIVWSRIHPTGVEDEPNVAGLAYYDEMVDELLAAGIEPVASLVHFDMPQHRYAGGLPGAGADYRLHAAGLSADVAQGSQCEPRGRDTRERDQRHRRLRHLCGQKQTWP